MPQQPQQIAKFNFFERQTRIQSCAVNLDVLRRIHKIMRDAGAEAASLDDRKQYTRIKGGVSELNRLYRATLIIRGAQGEVTATDDPASIEADLLPFPLQSIEFEIGFNYKTTLSGSQAFNRANVRFDFTRPPAFDISTPTSIPTPNISNISVFGSDTFWVSGLFERINAVIQQSALNTFKLHSAHAYDFLLIILGLPISFKLGLLVASTAPVIIPEANIIVTQIAVFFISFILFLLIFRIFFGFTRWLLPYVEYISTPLPIHRQIRAVIATVIVAIFFAVLGNAVYNYISPSKDSVVDKRQSPL